MSKSYKVVSTHTRHGQVVETIESTDTFHKFNEALAGARDAALIQLQGREVEIVRSSIDRFYVYVGLADRWDFQVKELDEEYSDDVETVNLLEEMRNTLEEVNRQIDRVYQMAGNASVPPAHLMTTDGNLVLSPLLTTKASLLIAITEARRSRRGV